MSDEEDDPYSEDEEEPELPPDVSSDEEDGDDDVPPDELGNIHDAVDTRPIRVQSRRRTSNFMTSYEFSAVVGIRATQISNRGQIMVDPGDLDSSWKIAIKEIREKKCPLEIRRIVGRTPEGESIIEIIPVNDLAIPPTISLDAGG